MATFWISLIRLVNLLQQYENVKVIWNTIQKIRSEVSLEKLCNTQKTLYISSNVMSNIKEVEHELKINSSIQIIENISISLLETAGKMFLYLNSCPDHLKPWFFMYTDLFQSQTANQIILTLNRILKVDDSHQNKALKTIAAKLFDRITTLFSLKCY